MEGFYEYLICNNSSEIISKIKKKYKIIEIEYEILDKFMDITYKNLKTLNETFNTFFTPIKNRNDSFSLKKSSYQRFSCKLLSLKDLKPIPEKYIYNCEYCDTTIIKENENYILNSLKRNVYCKNKDCFLSSGKKVNPKIIYKDCIELIIDINNIEVISYMFGDTKNVDELKECLKNGYKLNIYGWLYGNEMKSYNFHIYKYDIITEYEKEENEIYIFTTSGNPNNEKQMIFSNFFSNLEFMKIFFNFYDYEIRERFPDFLMYCHEEDNVKKYIEFEFDVANYYKHGHDKDTNYKIEYLIAWKNTSKIKNHPFKIILLPDLNGKIIRKKKIEDCDLHNKLYNLICFLFSHRTKESLYCIYLHLISIIDVSCNLLYNEKLSFHIKNWSEKDEKSYSMLLKIFDIKNNFISLYTDSQKLIKNEEKETIIEITLQDSNVVSIKNELNIAELKEKYLIKKMHTKNGYSVIHNDVYNEIKSTEYIENINIFLIIASYENILLNKKEITSNDLKNIKNLLKKSLSNE